MNDVKRWATVGETVKIVKPWAAVDYEAGDTFVVTRSLDSIGAVGFVDNAGDDNVALEHEYVVLEP